jgi:hypothetical protein
MFCANLLHPRAYTFNGGNYNFGRVAQTLSNLDGNYEFSYYHRFISVTPGADYTCDMELKVGDASLRGAFEEGVNGWKSGSVIFTDVNTAHADVQLTVSCSGEYRQIRVNIDSF